MCTQLTGYVALSSATVYVKRQTATHIIFIWYYFADEFLPNTFNRKFSDSKTNKKGLKLLIGYLFIDCMLRLILLFSKWLLANHFNQQTFFLKFYAIINSKFINFSIELQQDLVQWSNINHEGVESRIEWITRENWAPHKRFTVANKKGIWEIKLDIWQKISKAIPSTYK